MDQSPDAIEEEIPDLYPSCAVTKAMEKNANSTENHSDIDLSGSLLYHLFEKEMGGNGL